MSGFVFRAVPCAIQRVTTRAGALCLVALFTHGGAGCAPSPPVDDGDPSPTVHWSPAFDTSTTGDLLGVWGSSPDDVYMVGGTAARGEVHHYDGASWSIMDIPDVPRLVWVFGTAADDVLTVGVGGTVLHYDGVSWTQLDSGETEALWGVWARSPEEWWIVGGDVGAGEPVLIRWDGTTFFPVPVPENDRDATALFKVWGIGSKLFAVGEKGLIIEESGGTWSQVPAGPLADDDFVSLWGVTESNIVAVGGRGAARIARYDGATWSTERPTGVTGLSGVFMNDADEAIVGGLNGYVAAYNPLTGAIVPENSGTSIGIHAIWGDGAGRTYAVGGLLLEDSPGVALVRTISTTE